MGGKRRKKGWYITTRIDWEKASKLFQQFSVTGKQKGTISQSAVNLLRALARAGEAGLIFLHHPDDPTIVGVLLGETQPYTWRTKQIIHRFQKQKYVSIREHSDGKITVNITKDGMLRALTYHVNTLQIKKSKQWDRKWRVIIFDIPERYRQLRDVFRMRLRQLGLYLLQESVYISPYPCFDEVEFLRELYDIAFTVRYLLVAEVEDDDFLKHHFGLS